MKSCRRCAGWKSHSEPSSAHSKSAMPQRSRRGSRARRPGGDASVAPRVRRVGGVVRPPGDKSISHRVVMLAALARGKSELTGLLTGDDVKSTARVLRPLGAKISPIKPGVLVRVSHAPLTTPHARLYCGNSG